MATITKKQPIKQPIKKPLTNDEKLLYGGGIVLLLGGGAIWYFRNKKEKEQEESTDYGTENTQVEVSTPVVPKPPKKPVLATPTYTTPKPLVITPVRTADNFRYAVGQEVKAALKNGTQTYGVIGTSPDFETNGVKKAKFNYGDKIGTIVWAGTRSNGTFRYVVKRIGLIETGYYWITDNRGIKPTGKILNTINFNASNLDSNKLLKRGVKGNEVKELQRRLNIIADGDFGKNTETALLHKKKTSAIRLKDWR